MSSDPGRARARGGGGRGGLTAGRVRPPPCVRAQTVRRSPLLARVDYCSKVDFVEAQRGPRCEHELVTAMYKTGGLERCQCVNGLHPTTDLRDQLV